jgi:hypothetical protein
MSSPESDPRRDSNPLAGTILDVTGRLQWKARVTVVENVYHQPMDPPGQPMDLSGGSFSVNLKTDEQPLYGRIYTISDRWVPLDLAWLNGKPVSIILVENLAGVNRQSIPSDEELADTERKVIELGIFATEMGVRTPFILIRPARSCRFEPATPVWIRCRNGECRIKVSATPGDPE